MMVKQVKQRKRGTCRKYAEKRHRVRERKCLQQQALESETDKAVRETAEWTKALTFATAKEGSHVNTSIVTSTSEIRISQTEERSTEKQESEDAKERRNKEKKKKREKERRNTVERKAQTATVFSSLPIFRCCVFSPVA